MNKRGGMFDVGVEFIMSPLKFITVAIFLLVFLIIVYSSVAENEIESGDVEGNEAVNQVLECTIINSEIRDELISVLNLENCLHTTKYGIKINYKDKEVIINDLIYLSYKDFCDRLSECKNFSFTDLNGNIMKIKVVFTKEKNE